MGGPKYFFGGLERQPRKGVSLALPQQLSKVRGSFFNVVLRGGFRDKHSIFKSEFALGYEVWFVQERSVQEDRHTVRT